MIEKFVVIFENENEIEARVEFDFEDVSYGEMAKIIKKFEVIGFFIKGTNTVYSSRNNFNY